MRIWPTKRGWKRIGIGLALFVAVLLVLNGFMAWRAEWRLQARLAEIRAAGDPASIAELAPPSIPDEENAAAIMEQVRPRLDAFGKAQSRFFNSPLGKQYDEARDKGEPATTEQIDAIRDILSKYADVEESLARASDCQQFASRMDFSLDHSKFLEQLLDRIQSARTGARLLGWRGEVLLADGNHEQALSNGLQALRLARLHENEPTLVAFLVAIAMRMIANDQIYDALAAGPVSPELHAALDKELALQDDPNRFMRVMKDERAVGSDWIHSHLDLAGLPPSFAHLLGWPMKEYQVGVLDAMAEYIQLAELPWNEVRGRLGLAEEDTSLPPTGHGVLADLLLPALKAAYQANARSLAVSRALRINNALRAFADEHGREATGLEELKLPADAVIDPHSGQPLKLKHTDDGWVVYSVMENGIDDGGDFTDIKDFGVGPRAVRNAN
jgi:hypothetical protein